MSEVRGFDRIRRRGGNNTGLGCIRISTSLLNVNVPVVYFRCLSLAESLDVRQRDQSIFGFAIAMGLPTVIQ